MVSFMLQLARAAGATGHVSIAACSEYLMECHDDRMRMTLGLAGLLVSPNAGGMHDYDLHNECHGKARQACEADLGTTVVAASAHRGVPHGRGKEDVAAHRRRQAQGVEAGD